LWSTFCSCVLPPTGSWSQRYKRQVKRRQQWQPETGSEGGGGGAGGAGAGWRRISCPVPATKTTITMRKGIGGKTELKIKLRGKKGAKGLAHRQSHWRTEGKAPQEKLRKCAPCRNGNGSRTGQQGLKGTRWCGDAVVWLFSGCARQFVKWRRGKAGAAGGGAGAGAAWQRAMTRPAPAVVSAKERKMTKSKGSAPHCAV